MKTLTFAADSFKDSLKSRDQKLVMWTQGLLAAMLLTLTMTSSTIQMYLSENLKSLLGADVVIEHRRPLSDADKDILTAYSQKMSEVMMTPVTLSHGDKWQRVALKVVDDHYPVQGVVKIADQLGGQAVPVYHGPKVGHIWVGERTASQLGLKVGAQVKIANYNLMVSAILMHEPDRLMEGHSVDMRAMVHRQSIGGYHSLKAQKKFKYLLQSDAVQRQALTVWKDKTAENIVLLDRHKGQHPFAAYWKRVENFLGLTFVLLFFMAAIAINLASRPKLDAMRYRLSVFMSMGMTSRQGLRIAFVEWVIAFVVTLAPAVAIAYISQQFIQDEIAGTFTGISGAMDPVSVLKTVILLFVMFLSIQIPMFIQLSKISILALIRDQAAHKGGFLKTVFSLLALSILAFIYTDNWTLTTMVIVSMVAVLVLLLVLSWVFFTAGNRWAQKRKGIFPFALFTMKNRLFIKSTQIIGLGTAVTLLLVSLGLMQDLRGSLGSQVRTSNGNLVISDMAADSLNGLQQWAAQTDSRILTLKPFLDASVTRINGKTLDDFATQPSEALARLCRPIRLSWTKDIPDNNSLSGGRWWSDGDKNWRQISVEAEVMSDMGLVFGDQLTFDVGGQTQIFTIVSSHVFKAGGSSITFWFQMPARARQHFQAKGRLMGSAEISARGWKGMADLLQSYPDIHVKTLREMTDRLDATFALVSKATTGFSLIIFILSVLVIIASVSGFESDDKKRNGLLLSMGLSQTDCLKMSLYEWVLTAGIAAIGAIAGTWLMGRLIYAEQLSMTYKPDMVLYSLTLLGVIGGVTVLGLYFCRHAMRVSIRQQLNEN